MLISLSSHASPVIPQSLYIVSFNVLAPCWAGQDYYPKLASPFLDRTLRRKHIVNFLTHIADKADIIALQETTPIEFNFYKEALQDKFYAFSVYHASKYWSVWSIPEIPWEPNGVAIFVKKTTFKNVRFKDVPLTSDGNHAAYFSGIQNSTGLTIHGVSIHLDSELSSNRRHELTRLIKLMSNEGATSHDIIIGDFNADTQTGSLHQVLNENHYIDALHFLKRDEWTHPFDVENDVNSGILAHIEMRNMLPVDGHVINFNLWKLFPKDETGRIIANFKISGSDHFPIFAVAVPDKN